MATNPTPTPDAGMTFDAAPVTAATPVPSTQSASASSPASSPDAGMTFDAAPVTTATPVPSTQSAPLSNADAASIAEGGMSPENQLAVGVLKGAGSTINGLGQIVNKITGSHIPDASPYLTADGGAQDAGKGIESVLEFMGGDAALKAAPIAESLSKMSGIAKLLTEHPTLAKIAIAGVTALRGGAVGAAQGGVKTDSIHGAVEGGVAGALGTAVPEAANAAKSAVRTAADRLGTVFSGNGAIQDTLQNSIRSALDDAANEAGVKAAPSTSVRDAATNLADAVKAKGSALYKQLDNAIGGTRFQTFDDQLKNITRALRNSAGIDPDKDGELIERINDIESSRDKALDMAREAGVDPSLIHEANSAWKQGSALEDLSRQIQASSEGIRPEMADGAKRPIPETVNPTKLNPRLDKMINSGRIQQAIGPERTATVRAAANDAHADTQTVQSLKAMAKKYAPYAALGIPGMYELIHHLTGE